MNFGGRLVLHDRLDQLQAARESKDPIRIARAKDRVRAFMEQDGIPSELFELALFALIDSSAVHGIRELHDIPYRWPEHRDMQLQSATDVVHTLLRS